MSMMIKYIMARVLNTLFGRIDMKEPEIGWMNYFVNHFTSASIVSEIMDYLKEYDFTDIELSFNTSWMDYSNKKLK